MIKDIINKMKLKEGQNGTEIDKVSIYRMSEVYEKISAILPPVICFIIQGQKALYLGTQEVLYNEDNFLLSSLTLPVETSLLTASKEKPFIGIMIDIDTAVINELLLDLEDYKGWVQAQHKDEVVASIPLNTSINDSLFRLLKASVDPLDSKVIGKPLLRELYFKILKDPNGYILRNSAIAHAKANSISHVIQYLDKNYKNEISIEEVADKADISPSSLHSKFKKVTSISPIQYVKRLRLHNAHSLLINGISVSQAGLDSGYNNLAQFSREFKREFGVLPSKVGRHKSIA